MEPRECGPQAGASVLTNNGCFIDVATSEAPLISSVVERCWMF